MGEAKRRKTLGLMPTLYPFKVKLGREGETEWLQDVDATQRPTLERFFREGFPTGAAWDSEYRTLFVMTDRSGRIYRTQADLGTIPVPQWRLLEGELALGGNGHSENDFPVEGGSIRLRERLHSFDGEKWESLPTPRDPQHILQTLQSHPAFQLEGEGLGQFQADHWQEGRIDISPELPEVAGLLEHLEELVREIHGHSPAEWQQNHEEMLDVNEAEDQENAPPAARRILFEIRRAAPLQTPMPPLSIYGDLEIHLLDGMAYSPDGDLWHSYEDPSQTFENTLAPELAEFFDLNTVTVTVYSDGRIEWDEDDDISEKDGEQIRRDLLDTTGAGDTARWNIWARQALTETFGEELDLPAGADFPVPVAFKLDIPRDVLGEDSPLSQTYMESEVTFDGQEWRDLFDEELPEELAAFAVGRESN